MLWRLNSRVERESHLHRFLPLCLEHLNFQKHNRVRLLHLFVLRILVVLRVYHFTHVNPTIVYQSGGTLPHHSEEYASLRMNHLVVLNVGYSDFVKAFRPMRVDC